MQVMIVATNVSTADALGRRVPSEQDSVSFLVVLSPVLGLLRGQLTLSRSKQLMTDNVWCPG